MVKIKIKVTNLFGTVDIVDMNTHLKKPAINNQFLPLQKNFKIAIHSGPSSGATVIVSGGNNEKINLAPNSILRLTEKKPKRPSKLVRNILGKVWLRVNNLMSPDKEFEDDDYNAVIGVRG